MLDLRGHVGTSVTGPWTQVGAVKTLDGAGQATSDPYTPPATGTYYFYVSYSGDSNYLPSESDPADEVLVVKTTVGGFCEPISVVPASIDYTPFVIGLVALMATAAYTAVRLRRRSKRKPLSHN